MNDNENKYDQIQLVRDLNKIVYYQGELKQRGFYTDRIYKCGLITILKKAGLPYPILYFNGLEVPHNNVKMKSVEAEFILHKVLEIEDYKNGK